MVNVTQTEHPTKPAIHPDAELKTKYGYPGKQGTCYANNLDFYSTLTLCKQILDFT